MPLQLHTQPDPDHFCETCGGPSELISQTITSWDGNETMAREVSPLLRVTQDDDDGVIRVDDDPIMRTAPLGVLSGAVVGVVTALPSG